WEGRPPADTADWARRQWGTADRGVDAEGGFAVGCGGWRNGGPARRAGRRGRLRSVARLGFLARHGFLARLGFIGLLGRRCLLGARLLRRTRGALGGRLGGVLAGVLGLRRLRRLGSLRGGRGALPA